MNIPLVKKELEKFCNLLIDQEVIKFPSRIQINSWESVLEKWLKKETIPLFIRKSSSIRGSSILHSSNRTIIITDNTPAHWVYKKVVLNKERLLLEIVEEALSSSNFPIAIMMKKTEKDYLSKSQIASKEFRLGNQDWKIAHLERIALPRTRNISLDEYKEHHRKFLSLKNMYIIKKEFSGLAEVPMFNEIILEKRKK